jgi:hypothetical protein
MLSKWIFIFFIALVIFLSIFFLKEKPEKQVRNESVSKPTVLLKHVGEECLHDSECEEKNCASDFSGKRICAPAGMCVHNGKFFKDDEYSPEKNFVCKDKVWLLANSQPCTSDSSCYSKKCKKDFDEDGMWCCNVNQCAHDGSCFDEGYSTQKEFRQPSYICMNGEWVVRVR